MDKFTSGQGHPLGQRQGHRPPCWTEGSPVKEGGPVWIPPGLGIVEDIVVDQHFRQRDRLGRLLSALAYNPAMVGIGLDEDTAAIIGPDDSIEIAGSGAITVVDPADVDYSSMDSANRDEPISIIGVRLHILVDGGRYNLRTREAFPKASKPSRR